MGIDDVMLTPYTCIMRKFNLRGTLTSGWAYQNSFSCAYNLEALVSGLNPEGKYSKECCRRINLISLDTVGEGMHCMISALRFGIFYCSINNVCSC